MLLIPEDMPWKTIFGIFNFFSGFYGFCWFYIFLFKFWFYIFLFTFWFKICTEYIIQFKKMLTWIPKWGYRSVRCRSQYSTSLKLSPPKLSRLLNSRLNLSLLNLKLWQLPPKPKIFLLSSFKALFQAYERYVYSENRIKPH